MPRILIVDDERNFREFLAEALITEGYEVSMAATAKAALAIAREESPHVVLLDQNLPDKSGLELLPELHGLPLHPVVIIITAHAQYTYAVEAVKAGAYHYITKPFEFSDLLKTLGEASVGFSEANGDDDHPAALSSIIGECPAIRELKERASRVARSPVTTVLVTGASGTGKELVARAIHRMSTRSGHPMVCVNCAALTETLLMSELFGHERGAFTDARDERHGVFEAADRGTLFLDEIGDIGLRAQAALLRVLEERVITRVGDVREIPVDVRIIAATNQSLAERVAAGEFREDLYFRLNVVELRVPPLSERGDDLMMLARHFSQQVAAAYGEQERTFSLAVEVHLKQRAWRGNIRELRNAIEYAYVVGGSTPTIELESLPSPMGEPLSGSDILSPKEDLDFQESKRLVLDRFEIDYLIRVLSRTQGNVTRAAEIAGVHRQGLQRLLRRHGISAEDFRANASH